jgi:hypothetical protein
MIVNCKLVVHLSGAPGGHVRFQLQAQIPTKVAQRIKRILAEAAPPAGPPQSLPARQAPKDSLNRDN